MEKKEKLIFWLVISILFLVYLVLEYIGYVRNLKLRWFSHEYYSKAYSKLEKADSKNKVKVILTSYDPVKLNSILDQSVRVDDIILVEKDTEKQKTDFPSVLNLYKYSQDKGDATALICAISREPNSESKLIFAPDEVLDPTYIQDIVELSDKAPNDIIYLRKGILVKPSFFQPSDLQGDLKEIFEKYIDRKRLRLKSTNQNNKPVRREEI